MPCTWTSPISAALPASVARSAPCTACLPLLLYPTLFAPLLRDQPVPRFLLCPWGLFFSFHASVSCLPSSLLTRFLSSSGTFFPGCNFRAWTRVPGASTPCQFIFSPPTPPLHGHSGAVRLSGSIHLPPSAPFPLVVYNL